MMALKAVQSGCLDSCASSFKNKSHYGMAAFYAIKNIVKPPFTELVMLL